MCFAEQQSTRQELKETIRRSLADSREQGNLDDYTTRLESVVHEHLEPLISTNQILERHNPKNLTEALVVVAGDKSEDIAEFIGEMFAQIYQYSSNKQHSCNHPAFVRIMKAARQLAHQFIPSTAEKNELEGAFVTLKICKHYFENKHSSYLLNHWASKIPHKPTEKLSNAKLVIEIERNSSKTMGNIDNMYHPPPMSLTQNKNRDNKRQKVNN